MSFALKSASGISLVRSQRTSSVRAPVGRRAAVCVRAANFATDSWIKKDPLVLGASLAGWIIPSNIGVSGFGGQSLFGLFNASIAEELAHFPQGPALGDKFWLYLISWHVGLFVVMLLGQIGIQGRKQGYF
ncbi:hypothetical protein FOA52_004485 [Chlamydomonas sp. UWO 241]|nr:hypothetical protein FOA52_004485 [Chlamydomonas sp. UWO 241]